MGGVWSEHDWRVFERKTARDILAARHPALQFHAAARAARTVLRTYSTSFFIVTRFLPQAKREQVEAIYAAVRYPDEIVDTFPVSTAARTLAIESMARDYEQALDCASLGDAVSQNLNCFIAAFAQVVRNREIPTEYYRSFLHAMALDIDPRSFFDIDDLIDSYIYGSATVVGYFLAYVYGASGPGEFARALTSSRDLAIALQLTNFLRDVPEDARRGRVYLPLDMLRAEGLLGVDAQDAASRHALNRVLRRVSGIAEQHYAAAERTLDSFAPDCRTAIQSCIDVYRQLNVRIGVSRQGVAHRETVPMSEKFRVLPLSKYWRLPLAYLGAI